MGKVSSSLPWGDMEAREPELLHIQVCWRLFIGLKYKFANMLLMPSSQDIILTLLKRYK